MREVLSWGVVLAIVVALHAYAGRGLVQGEPPELIGRLANGAPFPGLKALPKPGVIYFWATWCGVCKAMQSTISGVAEEVPLITVALQSGRAETVSHYLADHGLNYPTLVDEEGDLAAAYGVYGVPALFILDREGRIAYSLSGYTTSLGVRMRLWWMSLRE